MKRKKCRKRVKAELRPPPADTLKDALRRGWIANRCIGCGRCPKLIVKLAHELRI